MFSVLNLQNQRRLSFLHLRRAASIQGFDTGQREQPKKPGDKRLLINCRFCRCPWNQHRFVQEESWFELGHDAMLEDFENWMPHDATFSNGAVDIWPFWPFSGPSPSRARLKLAVTSVPWHRSQDKVTIKQTIKHVRWNGWYTSPNWTFHFKSSNSIHHLILFNTDIFNYLLILHIIYHPGACFTAGAEVLEVFPLPQVCVLQQPGSTVFAGCRVEVSMFQDIPELSGNSALSAEAHFHDLSLYLFPLMCVSSSMANMLISFWDILG